MNGGCRTGRACASRRGQLRAAQGDEEAARKDLDTAIEIFEKLERYIPPLQGRRSLLS